MLIMSTATRIGEIGQQNLQFGGADAHASRRRFHRRIDDRSVDHI